MIQSADRFRSSQASNNRLSRWSFCGARHAATDSTTMHECAATDACRSPLSGKTATKSIYLG
jgi:hypothetical protein